MARFLAPSALDELVRTTPRFAFIDVRERGEYNASHIPGSSCLPRRLLEAELPRLVPCSNVTVVLSDDDGRRAALAAGTAERMGYEDVAVLDGGLNAWVSDGFDTQWGLNVASKEFGERVEVEYDTPTVDAGELRRRIAAGERVLILDTRTPEEFHRARIPGGRNVPGGELAYRITDVLATEPAPPETVVINCAGRTRSTIGVRTLQRMGVDDVVGLRNGTQGWVLAGFDLEHGGERDDLPAPGPDGRAAAERFAERVAAEDGVVSLDADALARLLERVETDCTYLIDVRTAEEFAAGRIPGFRWVPGGQAVQRCDDVVAVRDATIVFCCDGTARSHVTASWFRQLGFPHVYAVDGGTAAWEASGRALVTGIVEGEVFGLAQARERVRAVSPTRLRSQLAAGDAPLVLFVDTSRAFAEGHVPGSRWLSRSRLELAIHQFAPGRRTPIVVTDRAGDGAVLAAASLMDLGHVDVAVLDGGVQAWRGAGLPLETGLTGVMTPPDDVVPVGTERTSAEMVHYLRWEEALGTKYQRGAH